MKYRKYSLANFLYARECLKVCNFTNFKVHALFTFDESFALIVWIKIYSIMGTVYYPRLRNFVLK